MCCDEETTRTLKEKNCIRERFELGRLKIKHLDIESPQSYPLHHAAHSNTEGKLNVQMKLKGEVTKSCQFLEIYKKMHA